jgi:hypothetical protein
MGPKLAPFKRGGKKIGGSNNGGPPEGPGNERAQFYYKSYWNERSMAVQEIYEELANRGYHLREDHKPIPVSDLASSIGWEYTQLIRWLNQNPEDSRPVKALDTTIAIALANYFQWPLVKVLRIAGYDVSERIAIYPAS